MVGLGIGGRRGFETTGAGAGSPDATTARGSAKPFLRTSAVVASNRGRSKGDSATRTSCAWDDRRDRPGDLGLARPHRGLLGEEDAVKQAERVESEDSGGDVPGGKGHVVLQTETVLDLVLELPPFEGPSFT